MKIQRFEEIVEQYKVVFFDAYGVLKTSSGAIPHIGNTFDFLKERGIPFYILTNDASRSPYDLATGYHELGFHDIAESQIISSGMLTRRFLGHKVNGGKVAYVGPRTSAYFIESLGLEAVHVSDLHLKSAEDISALALMDDEGFNWQEDINKTVNLLRQRNIPTIVANTDLGYPVSKGQVGVAIGAIADMIQELVGKQFIKFGKPDAIMFSFAFSHFEEDGVIATQEEVLMVGDTLATDILGGNKYGLDTALVLTGNTRKEDYKMMINAQGIKPTYVLRTAGIKK
jgi:HAD superfamily hydrolase (TIGR01450 family)